MKRLFAVIMTLCLMLGMLSTAQATMCAGEHTWGPWHQDTEATCLRPGWQSRTCTVCGNGYDYREYPPALGHNPTRQVREEPTCTKPGYYITVCSRCGQGLDNGGSIPALGHDYKRSVAQEATCTSDGMAIYTCSRCGDAYREPIPATGHKWGGWTNDTPSTCVSYGTRYHVCQRCGTKEWERNYADGLGDHDWGEWQVVQPATPTAPGVEERVCKIDSSHKEQREIPALGVEVEVWLDCNEKWLPEKYVIGSKIELDMYTVNDSNVPVTLTLTEITEHPVGDLIDPWPDINGAVIQPGDIYHWVLTIYINGADGMVGEAIRHIYQEYSYNDGTPALQAGQTNTIELHYPIEEEGPQYILKGVIDTYSGFAFNNLLSGYGPAIDGKGSTDFIWEDDNSPKGKYYETISAFYRDSGYKGMLVTPPVAGETYYFIRSIYTYTEYGHEIDYTQIDPALVSCTIPGFSVSFLQAEPGTDGDRDWADLYFAATYLGGAKVGVSVVDATDAWELEGAHVQLVDSNENVIDEWDSKAEIHMLQGLKPNEQYTLKETVAPEGYLSALPVVFTVDDENHVTSTGSSKAGEDDLMVILIENKKTVVGISKVDAEDGTALEGAYIQLLDSDGSVIDEWESTTEVHVIEGLKTNEEYTLTETVPPKGYVTAPASAFTIDEENHITSTGSIEAGEDDFPVLLIEDSRTTLLLEVVQTSPAKAVYELNDEIWLKITLTNTGEEPLNIPSYFYKWAYDNTTWSVFTDVTLAPGASEVFTDIIAIWQEDVDMGYMGLTFTGQAWQEDAQNPEIDKLSNNPGAVQSNTVELKWPTTESEETGSLLLEVSWAPDEGVGKVTGDTIRERFKLTNTGNTNVLVPARILSSDYEDVVQPNWYLEFGGMTYTVLKPGWDMEWTYIDQVYQEDMDIGAVRWSTRVFGYVLIGEDQQGESVISNWVDIDIPLTGSTASEASALTLTTYASPVKPSYPYAETYSECDVVRIDYVVTNTGKTPLYIRELENKWGDGFVSKYLLDILLYPGETFSDYTNVWLVTDVLTPNTDSPGSAGTVDVDFYAYGRDKNDYDAILCETAHCPYSFKMDAPGPTGWEIPSESEVWVFKSELSSSTLPEGYQKGEQIVYGITVINPSSVDVDDAVLTDAKLGVSEALPTLSGDDEGVWIISKEYTYTVTEDDVSSGGIYNEAHVEWTDPDSMEKKGDLDWLLLDTTDKTSLLLKKEIVGGPKNGEYYVEGEEITFSVTAKNNTDMVLQQVFVNDALIEGDSQTLMDIPDMQPGDEMTQSFKYKVTGGDVGIGYITNTATSVYEDAKGGWNHVASNPVTAYTGKKKPIEDDTTPEPPTPPYPPVFGVNSDIEISKAQDNDPANYSYYVEDETIRYAIIIKNTGEVPVDVEIYDSLAPGSGLIDTINGLAPNASKTVYYEYKVTKPDVDATCVVNYALAKWHPQGIWAETVYMSNKVTSPTSERPAPDGHLTFSGAGDSCYREVTDVNEYGASYTLHLCAEHAAIEAATQVKQRKGITCDWQKAVIMWREAVDKEYEEYLEAAEGAARVVIINERLTYYLWLGSYEKQLNLLYPDDPDAIAQKIAESLMDRCADLCYGEHNQGKAPQDSLACMRVMSGQQPSESCGRIVTGRSGNEIRYDLVLDTKHAATEKNVLELIGEATDGAARANAWTRGQQLWQMALDKEVNALYKAAGKEDRQVIAMTRRFLDQLVAARTALLEEVYSSDSVIVNEQIERLYKEYAMILCGK